MTESHLSCFCSVVDAVDEETKNPLKAMPHKQFIYQCVVLQVLDASQSLLPADELKKRFEEEGKERTPPPLFPFPDSLLISVIFLGNILFLQYWVC